MGAGPGLSGHRSAEARASARRPPSSILDCSNRRGVENYWELIKEDPASSKQHI
jgi:hypothetical protein